MDLRQERTVRHYARHLFLAGGIYKQRDKSRKDLDAYLQRMHDSVVKMRLGFSHIDQLKKKIDKTILIEQKYARLFRGERVDAELLNKIQELEEDLSKEREEKMRIKMDKEDKIKELQTSIGSIKSHMRYVLIEKAKKHHRLKRLEEKISGRVHKR